MPPEEPSLTPSSEKLILVVDDDQGMVEYLEMIVKKEGFRVETAKDGQEAMDKAQQCAPDLILLDLKLPKVQGLEMLRLLQAGDAARVPVIVITGHLGNRETESLIKQESNVRGYYTKPVNAVVLTMNIHSLLKTKPILSRQPADW